MSRLRRSKQNDAQRVLSRVFVQTAHKNTLRPLPMKSNVGVTICEEKQTFFLEIASKNLYNKKLDAEGRSEICSGEKRRERGS